MKERVFEYLDHVGRSIGAEFYVVGGSIRDELLGVREPDDFDLVARGLPEPELMKALRAYGGVEKTGQQFEVIRFHPRDKEIKPFDIALPRIESSTGDGHRDFKAQHDPYLPIEEDLKRRDFTVNAMAQNVHTGEFHDPCGGRADLEAGVLRGVHSMTVQEDPLRIIRALRFIAKLGFTVEEVTDAQIRENVALLEVLPGERIQMEFVKMMTKPHVDMAFRYAQQVGALPHFLPELEACVGCEQNHYHTFDVFEHIMHVVKNTPSDDPYVMMAALLHDIAKPVVKWTGADGVVHFYNPDPGTEFAPGGEPEVYGDHETVGAEMAYRIMRRFRFSTHHCARVSLLVREHMFAQSPKLRRRAARRFLARLDNTPGGIEANVHALFDLREGDCRGGKNIGADERVELNRAFERLVLAELEKDTAFTVRDLKLNGHDLMGLGLKGVAIGLMQKYLLERVLDDPDLNTPETLLEMCREAMATPSFNSNE